MPKQDLRTDKTGPSKGKDVAAAEREWKASSSDACPNQQVPNGNPGNVDPEVAKCLATKAQGKESLDMMQMEDGSWKWVQSGEVKGCDGDVEMCEELVKAICIKEKLYREPENNSKLHLALVGFTKIQGLDRYVNVKALFLEGNGITKIEGLSQMKHLCTLKLENNMISEISGLEELQELGTLLLNGNQINKLSGLDKCTALENLQVARNLFQTAEDIAHLADCPSIQSIDLTANRIEDGDGILEVFKKTKLRCLYVAEIPGIEKVSCARKAFIGSIPTVTFYINQPVDDTRQERRLCEAWVRGGRAAEDEERQKIQAEKKKKRLTRPGMKKEEPAAAEATSAAGTDGKVADAAAAAAAPAAAAPAAAAPAAEAPAAAAPAAEGAAAGTAAAATPVVKPATPRGSRPGSARKREKPAA